MFCLNQSINKLNIKIKNNLNQKVFVLKFNIFLIIINAAIGCKTGGQKMFFPVILTQSALIVKLLRTVQNTKKQKCFLICGNYQTVNKDS